MERYKIVFPTGYNIDDIYNDNLDVNIVEWGGKVYFATMFTIKNVQNLLELGEEAFFWSDSMIILNDLKRSTIDKCINDIVLADELDVILSFIGSIKEVYGDNESFETIDKISGV